MIERVRSPLPWLGGLLAIYLLAPIVAFLVRLHEGVSAAPGVTAALLTSLLTASISAVVIGLLGVPLAYLLARGRGPLSRVALMLVSLPLALPPLASGLLLLYVLGPYTALGELFGGQLTDTRIGIVLAQTFVAAPFLIVTAQAAFAAVDPSLEDMARALGHGRLSRFARVAVPAALPGIGAGLLLAWLRSFGEFGATVILAYHPYSLPVFTFVQFDSSGLPATTLPVVVVLAAALVFLLAGGLLSSRRRMRAVAGGTAGARETSADRPIETSARTRAHQLSPPAASLAAPFSPPGAAPAPPPSLHFEVRKRLGSFSLELSHRSSSPRLALLGSSGAGKTLTLRLLAGLTPSEGGYVRAGAQALDALPCERRGIGYVPQQPALVPRRNVWRQVTFGDGARAQRAAWWLARLGLDGLENRRPEELSGGQQRRVALARALAADPRVLLLDEPFTGLDAPVRDQLRRDLRRLQREIGLCSVIVTHDPEEAAMLADEIIVLDAGRCLQAGTREQVFGAPASPRVAALLGIANAHRGRAGAAGIVHSAGVAIQTDAADLGQDREVTWSVRPERVRVLTRDAKRESEPASAYRATLLDEIDLGAAHELTLLIGDELVLTARITEPLAVEVGQPLLVGMNPADVVVWPEVSQTQPPM